MPAMPAPITTTEKSSTEGLSGRRGGSDVNPMTSLSSGAYSCGTVSPMTKSISVASSSPWGRSTATGRPADQARTAWTTPSTISCWISSDSPPLRLSSMPLLRVGAKRSDSQAAVAGELVDDRQQRGHVAVGHRGAQPR